MRGEVAIAKIEEDLGSLEELAYAIIGAYPNVLDGAPPPLDTLALQLGVDMSTLSVVLGSPQFNAVMTQVVTLSRYNIFSELAHVELVTKKAVDGSGTIDQLVKAREHIGRLSGRPLSSDQRNVIVPIQVVFQSAPEGESSGIVTHHPARAGDLPPPGARRRYDADTLGTDAIQPGSGLDFFSQESPYKAGSDSSSSAARSPKTSRNLEHDR